jgi:hypothetical protein
MKNQNENNNSRSFENFGYQPRVALNEGLQPKASGKTLSPPKGGSSIKKK